MKSDQPFMSIIIPLHNEARRMREPVNEVIRFCERYYGASWEVWLCENGSSDQTQAIGEEYARMYERVNFAHFVPRSKSYAVAHGMTMARGKYRYACDVDLSTPIDALHDFVRKIQDGWDVVIGSREMFESVTTTTFFRWFVGRTFHALVAGMTGLEFRDTQCGFKLFTARAAREVFSRVQCESMAYDVEALYIARRLGLRCTEIPVEWRHDPDSRVRMVRDSLSMLREVRRIRKWHGGTESVGTLERWKV